MKKPGIAINSARCMAADCRVTACVETPSAVTVLLTPAAAPQATPLSLELDKAAWAAVRTEILTVHLPRSKLLMLKEGI